MAISHRLVHRATELKALNVHSPPDFLFTSGKPNRFNIGGVDCLYMAEDESTALEEYRESGVNIVVYKQQVKPPDYVRVLSGGRTPIDCWP